MGVPTGVWISAAIIGVIVTWLTIWVTNKAYSRKWEDHGMDKEKGDRTK